MTTEKNSVSVDSNMTDYANLAFNPYATSTDDLTFSTFGGSESEPKKDGKAMENGGFTPEPFVEANPHYEDTAEVVKKAGLNGTGRRKKENIVYEAAGYNKKPKRDERPDLPSRASNIPLTLNEDWRGISKNPESHTRWKLPFFILCVLVVICLVGSAFGVLAYFSEDEKCSCSTNNNTPQTQELNQDNNSTFRINVIENDLDEKIKEIHLKINTMNALLNDIRRTLTSQEEKINQTNATMNSINQQLNTEIQAITSAFNVTAHRLSQNVSSLYGDIIELKNISKEMGPRGFNGSQGPEGPEGPKGRQGLPGLQGPPGVGNISRCIMDEQFTKGSSSSSKLTVTYDEKPGWKVISAVCSTRQNAGAVHNVLSKENNRYTCTCAGESPYSSFAPVPESDKTKSIYCVIFYWECPELT